VREAFTARELAPKNLEAQVVFAHCLQLNTNLGEATRILQDLLKDQAQFAPFDPHHLREAVYILATVQRLLARYLAAANFYGQMIKYTPDEPLLYGHLADVLFLAGKQEDAEAAYRKAIELGPRLPTFYVRLGNALQSAGKHPEAIENYQKALELLDDPAVPSWRLAQIYLQQGQLTKATIHVEAAIATMGDDPEVQLIAARVLAKRGEVERAKAAFRRSIELDPTIFEAQHGLAELLRQSSDKSEQREGARLAELYSRVAPHMPRIERLRQELFLTPENGLLITRMAMLLNAIGQFQAAVPWVTEAVSANPRQPQARLTAAYIAANLGGMQRALTYFEEVQKLLGEGSESPEVQAYIDTIKNGGKLPTPLGAQTSDD
jgi:superkiller protein 3